MTNGFDDRKKAEEERFAHDEALQFKAAARRNFKLGLWVAELLGLSGAAAEEYAKSVIMADLKAKGVDMSEHRLRNRMAQLME